MRIAFAEMRLILIRTQEPVHDQLRFEFDGAVGGTAMLCDLLGRCIAVSHLTSNGGVIRGMMDLNSVKSGMYLLIVQTAETVRTGKVIVAK